MLKIISFSIVILCSLGAVGQTKISANCKADILYIQSQVVKEVSTDLTQRFPIHQLQNTHYLNLLFKVKPQFSESVIEDFGGFIGGKSNHILSVKWPINQIDELWNLENVEVIQLAHKVKPDLTRLRYDTRVDSVHAGIGLSSAFTGKEVLIGITDWGFDYSSPMFYDTLLLNTRILSAWDQFKVSGPSPTGFNYGTEFNTPADLIAAGSDTANIYSYGTHGTHVAGIAGGSGAGTDFRGVAFESQFLMTTFLADEGAVLDAWQWMYDKAQLEGKRLVVNMSWGLYHTGALDGTSLLSQALDNFSQLGVVFVTSAGNNGDETFHIKYNFVADTMRTKIDFFSGNVPNLWGQSIHAWGEPNASFQAKIKVIGNGNVLLNESDWFGTNFTTNYVDSFLVAGSDTVFFNLSADAAYPTNNRPQMRLRVKLPTSNHRIVLESTSSSGIVHFWNVTELTTDVGNWGMPFSSLGADYTVGDGLYSIGAPACTETAITVAAHRAEHTSITGNFFPGIRSEFSSIGPLITEEIKPDISAPGQGIASSISSYTDNNFTSAGSVDFNGRTYPFARFSGTSMSSPAVAGIAALMLEANPNLSSMQVKQILMQTARTDGETGAIVAAGDPMWGAGKADAYFAIRRSINTVGLSPLKKTLDWKIYPNPTTGIINIEGLTKAVKSIQIINLNGQVLAEFENASVLDVGELASGFYIIRLGKAQGYEQQSLILK